MSPRAKLAVWVLGSLTCGVIGVMLWMLWKDHPAVALMLTLGLVIGWAALRWGRA